MGGFRFLVLTLAVLGVVEARQAHACSIAGRPILQIQADPTDTEAPSTPVLSDVKTSRGPTNSSCSDLTTVRLKVESTDNRGGVIGYTIISDKVDYYEEGKPLLPDLDGTVALVFVGELDRDEDIRFDVRIAAVDGAGNVSMELQDSVSVEGESRCAISGTPTSVALWSVALLALASRRRRRASARAAQ